MTTIINMFGYLVPREQLTKIELELLPTVQRWYSLRGHYGVIRVATRAGIVHIRGRFQSRHNVPDLRAILERREPQP